MSKLEQANFNVKFKPKKRMAAHEFQDRAARLVKEFKIPKEITLKGTNKILPLKKLVFQLFKLDTPKAEDFAERSRTKDNPGRYFCYLMLNRSKI